MKKSGRVIGYIFLIFLIIFGGAVFLYSDIVEPLRYKYPLGMGSCLAALALAWLFSNADKRRVLGVFSYMSQF